MGTLKSEQREEGGEGEIKVKKWPSYLFLAGELGSGGDYAVWSEEFVVCSVQCAVGIVRTEHFSV